MTASAEQKSDLPARFAAGVVMIAVAVVVAYAGGLPFRILAAVAASIMVFEWAGMHRVPRLWTMLAIVLLVALLLGGSQYLFPLAENNPTVLLGEYLEPAFEGFLAVAAAAVLIGILSRRLAMAWGFLYIGLPAFALVVLSWAWSELVLWLLIVVWATDIFAYAAGRAIGGPRLAPRISPNKTWAGLVGGLLGAAAAAWIAGHFMQIDPIFLYLGAPMGLLAQLGDLYESAVKRRAGVKDSGTILPGHGGVLDRLDGLLPVALASYAVLMWLTIDRL
jgi:phosphatidate cytidylyltransferase